MEYKAAVYDRDYVISYLVKSFLNGNTTYNSAIEELEGEDEIIKFHKIMNDMRKDINFKKQ